MADTDRRLVARLAAAIALAAIWLLALTCGGPDRAYEAALLRDLSLRGHDGALRFVARFTDLGGWACLVPLTIAGALYLVRQRRRAEALALLAITLSGRLAVEIQKQVIGRPRPEHGLVDVVSASFPSAHAANSMIVFVTLATLLSPSRRCLAVALSLALAIGLTRPLLGVHWATDVVAGWAFGLFWVGLFLYPRRYRERDRQ